MNAEKAGGFALRYWVDERDCLARVDDAWRAFAVANGAAQLASDAVLGKPLAAFCSDATTSKIWGLLLARARSGAKVEVPIRCDAPDRRRLFQLETSQEPDGLVRLGARLLSEEVRPRIDLLAADRPHSSKMAVCCSWCKRFRVRSEEWVEVEQMVALLRVMEHPFLPALSHGICRDCVAKFKAQLQGG